ncbi:MAG: PorT family protein [Bacteroidales bacterium]|nr:PorT family protein [Bacteroidales bacterium]
MKKLVLLSFALIVGSIAFAQIPGFSIGPKIGTTFSKFTTDEDQIKEEMKNSFFFGAFVRLGNKIYLQPELLVMSRNGILKDENAQESQVSLKIHTIDVPILLGIKVLDLKAANVRVMAGPVASFVIDKNLTGENWNETINEENFKNMNWGLQFGAGVDVLFLTLDVRYEIGLNDVSKLENFSLKNNMFTVGLGWKIL